MRESKFQSTNQHYGVKEQESDSLWRNPLNEVGQLTSIALQGIVGSSTPCNSVWGSPHGTEHVCSQVLDRTLILEGGQASLALSSGELICMLEPSQQGP